MYVHTYVYACFNERRKEGRKKQARSNKQQGKAVFALPCCLFNLACFFLPSFSSLITFPVMYMF